MSKSLSLSGVIADSTIACLTACQLRGASYSMSNCTRTAGVRGNEEAEEELEEIRAEKTSSERAGSNPEAAPAPGTSAVSFEDLVKSRYLTATLVAVCLQMAQQIRASTNAVLFHSSAPESASTTSRRYAPPASSTCSRRSSRDSRRPTRETSVYPAVLMGFGPGLGTIDAV